MPNDKSPGNDGLTKEFMLRFYVVLAEPLINSLNNSFEVGELFSSQKQAMIIFIEKEDKDKRLIKKWRPVLLLNVDTKILSKAFASRLKSVRGFLVTSDQTAYVPGKFVGESVRLISDILEYADNVEIPCYMLSADIEKAFDSVSHTFLIAVLKKFGFGEDFIRWIRKRLVNQESCVMNNGHSTGYLKLHRGSRQGDPISAFLFILVLEVLLI